MERYATVLSLGKSTPHADMLQMLQPWAIYVSLLENLIDFAFWKNVQILNKFWLMLHPEFQFCKITNASF